MIQKNASYSLTPSLTDLFLPLVNKSGENQYQIRSLNYLPAKIYNTYKVSGKDFTVVFEKQDYFLPKIEQTVQTFSIFFPEIKKKRFVVSNTYAQNLELVQSLHWKRFNICRNKQKM